MARVSLRTKEEVVAAIERHTQKILLMRDQEGMIPSSIRFRRRDVIRAKDVPRQSMAVMALSFANTLVPSLGIGKEIASSRDYVERNLAEESPANQLFSLLYLALERVYARADPSQAIDRVQRALSPELFAYPIAANLYLRLSALSPRALPHAAYVLETQRYNLSLTPRRHRFFDYADALVWGKMSEPGLSLREYEYLLARRTPDAWFADPRTGAPATSSVVAKFFEVFAYYGDTALAESVYAGLEERRATSDYARRALGEYADHILSEPSTLHVDDAHFHVLVGLCYRYQAL